MAITTSGDGETPGLNIYQLAQLETQLEALGYAPGTSVDSLSPSEQQALILNLLASNPMLFGQSNLYTNAMSNAESQESFTVTLGSIESQKDKIISAMLDAWAESVAVQAAISKKESLKQDIIRDVVEHDIKQQNIMQDFIEWEAKQPNRGKANIVDAAVFASYLGSLLQSQRHEELTATVNLAVGNYFDRTSSPAIEDNPLTRSVLSAVLLQTLVIGPASQNVVMQPIAPSSLSTQIGVNPVSDQAVFQPGLFPNHLTNQVLPAINFFVLDLVKDVMVTLYIKEKDTGKPPLDKDFANAVADKILGEVSNRDVIKEKLIRQIPGMEQATTQQLNDAATYAQLFSLVSSLALFVKVDGGTLGAQELKEMLLDQKGLTGDDNRSKIASKLNEIIQSIVDPNVRATFVEATLKYLASMPDPSRFTDIMHALNAAALEVNMGQRAVQTRRD